MEQSTTGQAVNQSVADNSSTTETTTNPAEQSIKELGQEPQISAQDSSAKNNTTEQDAEALKQFAKGQGISDVSELSERELSLLKIARDAKSAFDKSRQHQPKLDESSKELAALGDEATDMQKLTAKVQAMEFSENKKTFFKDHDATVEPAMAQIVADIRDSGDSDYARKLINNLPLLYSLASVGRGGNDTAAAIETARQEERISMNKTLAAGSLDAHATNSAQKAPVKVTNEWIEKEYDPSNQEHRALVDALTKM